MSQDVVPYDNFTVYGVTHDSPPGAWTSTWTMLGEERVSGGDMPEGYFHCTQEAYEDALQQMAEALKASELRQLQFERVQLSNKRLALVATGLSAEAARILVPDPNNDYTLDEE